MRKRPPLPDGDDGRQIADMSGVEAPSLFGHLPRREGQRRDAPPEPGAPAPAARPWEQNKDDLTPEERRIYMWAAFKAALFIGLFYIVGLGAVILLLLLLWSH